MATERTTEIIVYDELKRLGFKLSQDGKAGIEMQTSSDPNIQRLISSKNSGRAGAGMPEYIIKLRGIASDLLIIECKRDKSDHASVVIEQLSSIPGSISETIPLDVVKKYAEDGVIHYMKGLSKEYNVVGVAISGTDPSNLKISTFTQNRGSSVTRRQSNIDTLLAAKQYIALLQNNGALTINQHIEDEIEGALPEIHNFLRDEMELGEQDKPLIISAILLGLTTSFSQQWRTYATNEELADGLLVAIKNALHKAKVSPQEKIDRMLDTFSCVKDDNIRKYLKPLIEKIDYLFQGINFSQTTYDIAGAFYNEFLKYTGGDKQGLGIVLTPKHVTELFSELAFVTKDSVVIDTCTGTGGFLISAMNKMISMAGGNEEKIEQIKKQQLIGVELKKEMFTLACSNMILRNDGKANMFNMSTFALDEEKLRVYIEAKQKHPLYDEGQISEYLEREHQFTFEEIEGARALSKIKQLKPTVCLINPPYSKKNDDYSELSFIKKGLDLLEPGGKLVAIVPVSCGIEDTDATRQKKQEILKSHKLEAVLSMPNQLFPNVGTVTCIMVFTAKQPHNKDDKVYFGYYKDDGFKLSKNTRKPIVKTTIDGDGFETLVNAWEQEKKPMWIKHYRNKTENIPGFCICVNGIDHNSEWLAEAYMETDFSKIDENAFIENLKKFNSYLYQSGEIDSISRDACAHSSSDLESKRKYIFRYEDVFDITKPAKLNTYNLGALDEGDVNFVTATESNNGVSMKADIVNTTDAEVITVASNGSVGEAFYQIKPFGSTADINVVKLRGKRLNPFLAMYLVTLIKADKFKYNYGRKWGKERMWASEIELPISTVHSDEQITKLLSPLNITNFKDVGQWISNVKSVSNEYDSDCQFVIDYIKSLEGKKKIAKKDLEPLQDMVRVVKTRIVNKIVDYEFMENYIKQLPHSSTLQQLPSLQKISANKVSI